MDPLTISGSLGVVVAFNYIFVKYVFPKIINGIKEDQKNLWEEVKSLREDFESLSNAVSKIEALYDDIRAIRSVVSQNSRQIEKLAGELGVIKELILKVVNGKK